MSFVSCTLVYGNSQLPSNLHVNERRYFGDDTSFGFDFKPKSTFPVINKYLLGTVAVATVSGIRYGYKCSIVYGIVGFTDEFLMEAGFSNKRYLTWGLLGGAVGNVLLGNDGVAVAASDVVGFVAGVLVPTGIYKDCKEIVTPVIGALAGNSLPIKNGVVIGGALSALDEILIRQEVVGVHYAILYAIKPWA